MTHALTPRAKFLSAGPDYAYDVLVEIPRQGILLANDLNNAISSALLSRLTAYWPMQETSGLRVDVAGINDLVDNNTVLTGPGLTGFTAKFVAANSEYFSLADNANISYSDEDFTFVWWVYFDTLPTGNAGIFGKWKESTDAREYLVDYEGSTSEFKFFVSSDGTSGGVGGVSASTFGAATAGAWNLVIAWHDSVANTMNIQINNGTIDSAAHSTGCNNGAEPVIVGAFDDPVAAFIDGRLANGMVINGLLTTAEKNEIWNDGLGLGYGYTRRKQLLSTIESILPPGGGLGAVNSSSLLMAVNTITPSLQATYDQTNPMHGSPCKVKLLFSGELYENAIELFTGNVDQFSWKGMDALITIVDQSLLEDHVIPHGLIDQTIFPNAPESSIGKRIPIVYGDSLGLDTTIVPLLLFNENTRQWAVSEHVNTYLSGVLLLWQADQDGYTPLNDQSFISVDSSFIGVTLAGDIKGKIFGRATSKHVVKTSLNAVNTVNAIDGDFTTDTELQTTDASGLGSITVRGTFPSTEDLITNLVAYWPFTETSGTRNDVVGSNHLTENNGPIPRGPAIAGHSITLVATSSQYLSIADTADLSTGDIDFAFGGQFYVTDISVDNIIISKRAGASSELEYMLWCDDEAGTGAFVFSISSTGTSWDTEFIHSVRLEANTWYTFICWHDSVNNILGIQLNNDEPETTAYTTGGRDGTAEFQVGRRFSGTEHFSGFIANLRFWKAVPTPSQRRQHWNAGIGIDATGLVFSNPVNNLVKIGITQEYNASAAATLENRSFVQSVEIPGDTSAIFNSMIYLWELNEASGNRTDLIANKVLVDASAVGSATGKLGDAADFVPASTDHFTLADEANIRAGQTLTWTLWVFVDVLADSGIFDKATVSPSDPDQDYRLKLQDVGGGNFQFSWAVSTNGGLSFNALTVETSFNISTSTWYFIRVWIDEESNEIGIQINDISETTNPTFSATNAGTAQLSVGRYANLNYFDGRIDNLMLHHRILSSSEHAALVNSGAGLASPFGEIIRRTIFDTQNHLAIEDQTWELPIQSDESRLGFDVTAQAFFPGGTGGSNDDVLVSEIEIEAGFRPDGNIIPLFMDRIQARPDDATGTITGTANAVIQNPADISRSILLNNMDGQSVETDLFDAARTDLEGSIFFGGIGAGYANSEIRVRELLRNIAIQARSYVFQLGTGEWGMKVFSVNRPTSFHFTQRNMLWESSGASTIPANRVIGTEVLPIPIDSIFNRFEIRYCWHPGRQSYSRVQFANSTTDSHSTEDLAALCATSVLRYGEQVTYQLDATHICDDATAEALLSHVVNYFTSYRMHIRFITTFVALELTLGDVVSVTHPSLPAILNGWRFEVLRLQYNLSRGEISIEAREMQPGTLITVGSSGVGTTDVDVTP